MAKTIVCSVRDRAMDGFMAPMFFVAKGQAVRMFQDECNRVGSEERPNPLNRHPEDYDLYYLGTFDEESGKFDQADAPKQLAIGKDMIKGGE